MRFKTFFGLFVLVFLALVACCCAGIGLDWGSIGDLHSSSHRVLFELRLPRAGFVFFAGALLAAVGAVYQILFHNPLAEPYLLGVSSAATLGIALSEAFWAMPAASPLAQGVGLCFAVVLTVALLALSFNPFGQLERVVLFGFGANFILSSILFLLLSYQAQSLGGGSLRWLFGQVPWLGPKASLLFCTGALSFLSVLLVSARSLDVLAFGDGVARSLGFGPRGLRLFVLAITCVAVAWLVSFTGTVGFVGLVAPHCARLLFHPSTTRRLLLLCVPLGGAFLLFSDALSRSLLPPIEFPVGILTTLVGGPLFLLLLWKR